MLSVKSETRLCKSRLTQLMGCAEIDRWNFLHHFLHEILRKPTYFAHVK